MTSVSPITSQPLGFTNVPSDPADVIATQPHSGHSSRSSSRSGGNSSGGGCCAGGCDTGAPVYAHDDVCCCCCFCGCDCDANHLCCCLCDDNGCWHMCLFRSPTSNCHDCVGVCCSPPCGCCDACCRNCESTMSGCTAVNKDCCHMELCCGPASSPEELGSCCNGGDSGGSCCDGCGGCNSPCHDCTCPCECDAGVCECLAGCCECLGAIGEGLSGIWHNKWSSNKQTCRDRCGIYRRGRA